MCGVVVDSMQRARRCMHRRSWLLFDPHEHGGVLRVAWHGMACTAWCATRGAASLIPMQGQCRHRDQRLPCRSDHQLKLAQRRHD